MQRLVVLAVALVAVLAGASAGRGAGVPFCTGGQLSGTFRVVPGSAGAGNIVYRLRLTNKSSATCAVSGLPMVHLYGRTGKPLPTHPIPAFRAGLTAVLVRISPGGSAHATARFSPDVPGTGEPVSGMRCEPVAYSLHVTARGGGVTKAAIKPATPVCEHGQLQLSAYGPGA
jgi:Domain of unknown function (DUF4232)